MPVFDAPFGLRFLVTVRGEIREIAKDRNILVQAEQGRLSLSNIYAETVYKGLELGWDATL